MEDFFKSHIRNVPNFPKQGIMFRDITTLLKDAEALSKAADVLYNYSKDMQIDKVVGIDSRGFIFGGLLAQRLGAGLALVRKPGKLPAETLSQSYELEYGSDTLQIHKDSIVKGERVLLHDDLLATGGTARAACDLIEKAGGIVVQVTFLVELTFLNGRARFREYDLQSMVKYDSD